MARFTRVCSAVAIAAMATAAGVAQGAVLGITGITPVPAPDGFGNIASPLEATAFTTSAGTTTTIAGATSAAPGGSGQVGTNYWGYYATEVDGAASLVGLDVSDGVINLGNYVNVFFGVSLNSAGAAGDANDIFITEFGGADSWTIKPIDSSGNVIGDFSLTLAPSNWTTFNSAQVKYNGGEVRTNNMNGVAFDLSDFVGTGTLSGVAGIQLNSAGGDPGVIAYNTAAVPEPAVLGLLGIASLGMLRRRRNA